MMPFEGSRLGWGSRVSWLTLERLQQLLERHYPKALTPPVEE